MSNFDCRRVSVILPLAILAGLFCVPYLAGLAEQPFYVSLVARIIIYAIAATGLNLALGDGGLVSFGHALFIGLGVYSVALPASFGVDNVAVHLALCLLICSLVGVVTGHISLRTSGMSFIMITLAFAQMGYFMFVSLKQFGGDDGMGIALTSRFGAVNLGDPLTLYVVSLVTLVLLITWFARLRVAPFGMVLRATRQNARRVNALGFSVKRYQLVAYVVSACVCGVAGLLLANHSAFASPSTMSWLVSGELIVMVVLGGMGSAFGSLLGAVVYLVLEEVLKGYSEHWMLVLGPLIVCVALLGKGGLVGFLAQVDCRLVRSKVTATPLKSLVAEDHK